MASRACRRVVRRARLGRDIERLHQYVNHQDGHADHIRHQHLGHERHQHLGHDHHQHLGHDHAAVQPPGGKLALRQTRAATRVIGSALSPNGELLAAAGADRLVWLWSVTDPSQPKLLAKLAGFKRWAYTVVFSSSGQTLFAGSADHTVRIWNLSEPHDPQELKNSPLTGPHSTIEQLALSPDNRTLAALTADGQVWMWAVADPSKADLIGTLTAATGLAAAAGQPAAIAFSPTDNTLVAGGNNGQLTFWHYRPYQAVTPNLLAVRHADLPDRVGAVTVPGVPYNPPVRRGCRRS